MTDLVNRKYRLLDKIGGGSFGAVYKGQHIRTHEFVAIKVEPIEGGIHLLKNESIIYQYLQHCVGVPSVKWFGKDEDNYYMVINLLGDSLQHVKTQKTTFSLKLTLQIGIQIVKLLKTIHDKGLVHRDIKPDNFLLGLNNDKHTIYIVDFGFCKTYMRDNCHIPNTRTKSLIGSLTYASTNAHKFSELSRRDDMESLGYMLLYFFLGVLPWQTLLETENSHSNLIELKQKFVHLPEVPLVISEYMDYIKSLEFEDAPDYEKIVARFEEEIVILVKNS
ncbi:MAG: casein kinase 1 family protein [Candidatus Marinimicrobia bacterium]|nr:casein kinase 1 family protein [Candidatus Neomarinimicrobiota bacterium]